MDVTAITTLITNVGFPIAICLWMMWYNKYQDDQHKEEINKLSEAINNNTIVMTKLLDKLGGEIKND